nr:hypothetical protein [Tanacetum cinerariifolium]
MVAGSAASAVTYIPTPTTPVPIDINLQTPRKKQKQKQHPKQQGHVNHQRYLKYQPPQHCHSQRKRLLQ